MKINTIIAATLIGSILFILIWLTRPSIDPNIIHERPKKDIPIEHIFEYNYLHPEYPETLVEGKQLFEHSTNSFSLQSSKSLTATREDEKGRRIAFFFLFQGNNYNLYLLKGQDTVVYSKGAFSYDAENFIYTFSSAAISSLEAYYRHKTFYYSGTFYYFSESGPQKLQEWGVQLKDDMVYEEWKFKNFGDYWQDTSSDAVFKIKNN